MNNKLIGLSALLLAVLLAGCMVDHSQSTTSRHESVASAEKQFAEVFENVMKGHMTGDTSSLVEYLESEDESGTVRDVFSDNGLDPYAHLATAKGFLYEPDVGLPDFTSEVFADGDVLLSRDETSFISNFLAWLILAEYTHSGVLDQEMAVVGNPEAGCVISATLNDEISGVTYETWMDWNTNTKVAQMRLEEDVDSDLLNEAQDNVIAKYGGANSAYEFVYFHPDLGLVPASAHPGEPLVGDMTLYDPAWPPNVDLTPEIEGLRYDNYRWYCSKTTWWIYKSMGIDIENNMLVYFTSPTDSGYFVLYKAILDLFGVPDSHQLALYFVYFTADMVVWPDEIRWATTDFPSPYNGPLTILNVWSD